MARLEDRWGTSANLAWTLSMTGVLVLSFGCTTSPVLTEGGARVAKITQADIPAGCRVLGDVPIGVAPDASRPRTEGELFMLMRNKAAEAGATHVVVDSNEQRTDGTQPYYTGRATAYACRDNTSGGPPEESTGEAGAAGGDAEGAQGDGDEASSVSDEDLL